jgi:dihydropteroate synthase type 2
MVRHLASSGVSWHRPRLVGIVNVTADSFSDGGRFLAPKDALAHARRLHAAGADVVELGPAASHPGAERVTADEEVRRLDMVLDQLVAAGIPVSVDSFQPQTQQLAAARGATFLNDIQGFPDPDRYAELADTGCHLIVMHSVQRRGPATKVRTDPQTVLTRNRGASLVAELYAASLSVDFIQTHDVAALRDALTVLAALDQHAGS